MTGIKGTGMAALAEILVDRGAQVSGSDVAERFFTDDLLAALGVTPSIGFDAAHVSPDTELLVYSSAYDETNPQRQEALRRGIPAFSYPQMLGALSQAQPSLAVAGVHGKTSTTAMIGAIVRAGRLPGTVVVGSAVPDFGGSATLRQGGAFLVAETCEYRRHFLDFHPQTLLVTSIEPDHLDYYRDAEDVAAAFRSLADRLPHSGTLVSCADDPGARELAAWAGESRPDLRRISYGRAADADLRITDYGVAEARQHFGLEVQPMQDRHGVEDLAQLAGAWSLGVPGDHMVANATGALAALSALVGAPAAAQRERWAAALSEFAGTRRRSELIAEVAGVRIMDDYAHHPTAIRLTLAGYRRFWPDARIIVDFMSHTYSRSISLLSDFTTAFADADWLILNSIYASARERADGVITGEQFATEIARCHPRVDYEPDFDRVVERLADAVRPGDLVVTMGAGDNFRIAGNLRDRLRDRMNGEQG